MPVRFRHPEVYDHVWADVPPSGQSLTVQGELLRAAEKLWHEAERNGNVNWDDGFRILHRYLERHLLDGTLPDQRRLKSELKAVGRYRRPVTDTDLWTRLVDSVCEWCIAHPEPIRRSPDPNLHR